MPLRSARTRPSETAPLSPKMTVLTASFIAAPVPSGPRWKMLRASRSRTGRARLEVGGVASDHDRQVAGARQGDAAGDRRVEHARAPSADVGRERLDRVGQDGAHVDGNCACAKSGEDAIRARVQGGDRGVVRDHRDDDVGVGGGLGRGGRHGRADPLRQRLGPVLCAVVERRAARPARPGVRPSPSPCGRSPGSRPSAPPSSRAALSTRSRRTARRTGIG